MADLASPTLMSAADFLHHPDASGYELVGGEFVELNRSAESNWIAGELGAQMSAFCRGKNVGWVFPQDSAYQCFPDPNTIRKPDVSFLRRERLPVLPQEGYIPVAPDLAVEVLSSGDLAYDVDIKVELYLSVGVQLVWVVHPRNRTVNIHRHDGTVATLTQRDELDGETVLPEFKGKVSEIFSQ